LENIHYHGINALEYVALLEELEFYSLIKKLNIDKDMLEQNINDEIKRKELNIEIITDPTNLKIEDNYALYLEILGTNYHKALEMLDFLKGPEQVSPYEKQFYKERLQGKEYLPLSYFDGATPQNGYTPVQPMTVEIYENPYSFDNEHWATLWVKSGGADNMRSIKFRQKPSTGQWFLNDIQCLSEIRLPAEADPWA